MNTTIKLTIIICCLCLTQLSRIRRPAHKEFTFASDTANKWSLRVRIADTLTLKIKGNATTGYQWVIYNYAKLDKNILEATNLNQNNAGTYVAGQAPAPGVVGAPGTFNFDFKLKTPGKVAIQFVYIRPWEAADPSARKIMTSLEIVG
jgi:predicted secreted protein